MIKLVAFDWNGTLISDTTLMYETSMKILASYGKHTITIQQYRGLYCMPLDKFWLKLGFTKEELRDNMSKISAEWHTLYEPRAALCRTRTGAKRCLEDLKEKNIESVILSNHITEAIYAQLFRLKLTDYFTAILANTDKVTAYQIGKQHRLERYMRKYYIKPSEVIVVGDTSEEIEIAKNIGAKSIAITDGCFSKNRLLSFEPDCVYHNLKNVIHMARSW